MPKLQKVAEIDVEVGPGEIILSRDPIAWPL
jgi:hypothetical protein